MELHLVTTKDKSTVVISGNQGADLHVNPDKSLNYGLTVALAGRDPNEERSVQASFDDTIPLKQRIPHLKHHFPRYTLQLCPDDSLETCVAETKAVIAKLLDPKSGAGSEADKDQARIVNYVSSSLTSSENTPRGRTIQIQEFKQDPLIPSRFKLRKNRHRPPSPPPPVLKDPAAATTKLTKEERAKWTIPSAISNWKNNQGFTLSLDKRVIAAHGGTEKSTPDVNTAAFGELSSALSKADELARVELAERGQLRSEQAKQEKSERQENLRLLANDAKQDREKRAYMHPDREAKRTRR